MVIILPVSSILITKSFCLCSLPIRINFSAACLQVSFVDNQDYKEAILQMQPFRLKRWLQHYPMFECVVFMPFLFNRTIFMLCFAKNEKKRKT